MAFGDIVVDGAIVVVRAAGERDRAGGAQMLRVNEAQQPDFSTLPPSIAASLARLASGDPLQKSEGTQPRKEPKIASKG